MPEPDDGVEGAVGVWLVNTGISTVLGPSDLGSVAVGSFVDGHSAVLVDGVGGSADVAGDAVGAAVLDPCSKICTL